MKSVEDRFIECCKFAHLLGFDSYDSNIIVLDMLVEYYNICTASDDGDNIYV